MEEELNNLKKNTVSGELEHEIEILRKAADEKEKEIQKDQIKHSEEVKALKKQQMQTSETLRATVLERENLRETDRIMLNTFDMMNIYIDQIKNREARTETQLLHCEQCEYTTGMSTELKQHVKIMHEVRTDNAQHKESEKETDEDIVFCCMKCRFETKYEKYLTEHIKKKHGSFKCEECNIHMETENNLRY